MFVFIMKKQCVFCDVCTEILTRSQRFYLRYVPHVYRIAKQAELLSMRFNMEEFSQK